jgi:hypothetical protein
MHILSHILINKFILIILIYFSIVCIIVLELELIYFYPYVLYFLSIVEYFILEYLIVY